MLVSDDMNSLIYKLTYIAPAADQTASTAPAAEAAAASSPSHPWHVPVLGGLLTLAVVAVLAHTCSFRAKTGRGDEEHGNVLMQPLSVQYAGK